MDIIAHEIAHFILGHHKNQNNPSNEREADDLTEQWGFERMYKENEYPDIKNVKNPNINKKL